MVGAAKIAPVRKTIVVHAPQEHAFAVFTARMGEWWNPTHSISATKSPIKDVVIEPRVGGRWYEQGEDGSQCDWGRVLAWEPPSRLLLAWQLNAQWVFDENFITELEIQFTTEPNGTRVDLEHRDLERFGQAAQATHDALNSSRGWTGLLEGFRQQAGKQFPLPELSASTALHQGAAPQCENG